MNKLKDEEEITELQKIGVFLLGCILSKPSVSLLALALTLLALLTSLCICHNNTDLGYRIA